MSTRPIAIVGLGALLPGAPDAEAWLAADSPSLTAPPPGRFPDALAALGLDGLRGGFVHGDLAASAWVDHVVRRALPPTRGRTSLTMARLGLPTTPYVRAVGQPLAHHTGQSVPWLEGPTERASASALSPGLAEELDLVGLTALDAACASGLYALALAADQLLRDEVDCALAVAEQRSDSSYLFLGFRALHALSPTFRPRPLEADADGLVVGEGAVAVALKRLDDAVADGDRIHAVLRGWGLGNDGRKGNLLAPSATGQARALRAAWRHAGLDPATLGFAELHATGTPVGDGVELLALQELVRDADPGQVRLGASKRLVGHTITTAGLAGLLRAVGAVRDGVRPASPVERPREELSACPSLRIADAPALWRGTRRASVSAFGFGGCNAHVVLDAYDEGAAHPQLGPAAPVPGLSIASVAVAIGDARDAAAGALLDTEPVPPPSGHARGLAEPRLGWWLSEVQVDPARYRIPPLELAEFLPQQLVALELCADAVARADGVVPERTAVVIAMAVDPAVAEAVVRWAVRPHRAATAEQVHPPLSASRVQGSLPNVVANRIATQLDLQGPSYVVFDPTGGRGDRAALHHAARLLAHDEALDAVVVGAVDVGARPSTDHPSAERRIEGGCAMLLRRGDTAVDALTTAELPGHAGVAHRIHAAGDGVP